MGLVDCSKGSREHYMNYEVQMVSRGPQKDRKKDPRKGSQKAGSQKAGSQKAGSQKAGSQKAGSQKAGNRVRVYNVSKKEKVTTLVRRGVAASFDLFLLYTPAGIVGWVVLASGILAADKMGWGTPTDSLNQLAPWAVGFWVLGSILAESICVSRWGTTPGKRIVGLSVAESSGKKPNLRKLIERAVWKHTPLWLAAALWPPLVIMVVSIWLLYWLRSGQMLHDRFSKTLLKDNI